ncbi:MAG: fructose-bisphosphatase class II, partial [Methanosarcina sp.]
KNEMMPRLEKMGITQENFNNILDADKLVPGKDIIFSATAITSGDFLHEVNLFGGGDARVHTISMGASGVVRFTDSIYIKDKQETPLYL